MSGRWAVVVAVLWAAVAPPTAQDPGTNPLLVRRYQAGDRFGYLMTAWSIKSRTTIQGFRTRGRRNHKPPTMITPTKSVNP